MTMDLIPQGIPQILDMWTNAKGGLRVGKLVSVSAIGLDMHRSALREVSQPQDKKIKLKIVPYA